MPKIAEIEYTPNPHAVKFILKEPVAVGFPRSYPNREIAEADPLAKALFEVGHVVSVFMQDKILTVTKDEELTWNDLLPKLAPPIRSAPSAAQEAPTPREGSPTVDENDPFIQQIYKVLEDTIMPALAADGGGLEIVGRHDKQIMIRYQGACMTCPSGLTGTLMAIEGILKKEVDPEIVVITV
ncbi:NifU family protein [Holophaga foetida]|uniref:NifU family protein n=1 Tax=Holophaga foetida TaxID=35839 RepID=UPI000247335C|nr:NifU family protein [Holophaga foetida]